ncbi:hypothetical protein G9P44_006134 [Scheffersomyces stipitis]|nr:hypothetical protein G9P44_006134 [Scheffersomyces stipitis]
MSSRQAPWSQTCQNLLFGVRNYKPVRSRPLIYALNHPFCTNRQLLDTSYSNRLKTRSKQITRRLSGQVKRFQSKNGTIKLRESTRYFHHSASASSILIPQLPYSLHLPFQLSPEQKKRQSDLYISPEVRELIKQNNLERLCEHLKEEHQVANPHVLNYILQETLDKGPPPPALLLSECEIEVPMYKAVTRLDLESQYHKYIYDKIPYLYELFQKYANKFGSDKTFQESYIWLCYHMNDLPDLENTLQAYLSSSSYNSKTLAYAMSGFIMNYEVEFVRSLFQNIVSMGKPLHNILLETVVYQMSRVDALFENFALILQAWLFSAKSLDPPSVKALSLLLAEYHKFGTENEMNYILDLIEGLGVDGHYAIQLTNLQYEIINREPFHFKKVMSKDDLVVIQDIRESISDERELYDFYYHCLRFCSNYSHVSMIQYFIMHLKDSNLNLLPQYFEVILNYYMKNNKFIQLVAFLQSSSQIFPFKEVYLQTIFNAFIQSYPYHTPEFAYEFKSWIKHHQQLSKSSKSKLLGSLRAVKIHSQLTPYHIERNIIISNPLKYDSSSWKSIQWGQDKRGKALRFTDQVSYRVSKGFYDVLRKGVRPDFALVKETFRRSNSSNQKILVDLLKRSRMYYQHEGMLELLALQVAENTKSSLLRFYNEKREILTTNDKIAFSRMLINKNLFEEAEVLLQTIDISQVDDRTQMVLLNLKLRNYITYSQFDKMGETIESFPVDEIVLSPYIYKQCCYVEKKLVSKLEYTQSKNKDQIDIKAENSEDCSSSLPDEISDLIQSYELTLDKLRGLIGDIQLRLDKDELDIAATIKQTLVFLDEWITQSEKGI